jgi:hypothetical protein
MFLAGNRTRRTEFPHPAARRWQRCLAEREVLEGNEWVSGMDFGARSIWACGVVMLGIAFVKLYRRHTSPCPAVVVPLNTLLPASYAPDQDLSFVVPL